jgi:hypothetical protein
MIVLTQAIDSIPNPLDYPAWIAALSALIGVPLSLIAFLKLISRDKDREKQIASLTGIAAQLSQQVQELAVQTSEFRFHSQLMQEHNNILEMQLELTQKTRLEHANVEAEKLAIEKQQRLNDIRPFFTFKNSTRVGIGFELALTNKGATAIDISAIPGRNAAAIRVSPNSVDQQGVLKLSGNVNVVDLVYEYIFTLIYKDQDQNEYSQTIAVSGHNFKVDKPILAVA